MKKAIIILLIFILTISNVNAIPFATIATTGLNFINPEIANTVNMALCVSNPILCAQGKVVGYVSGQVYQQAYNAVSEVAGEEAAQSAAKAFDTYNQVKGYLDEGAEILNELEINEKGETNKGEIVFYEKGQDVGSLFGLENSDIFVENAQMEFNFEEVDGERQGYALANVNEGGRLWTTVLDENGNKIKRAYENIEGSFKLDKYGEIIEADFTTNEKGGSYIFTTTNTEEIDYFSGEPIKKSLLIDAPPNARVTYKEGEIKVYGKGKSFKLSQFSESNIMVSSNEITILDGDNVIIIGNKIIGKSFGGNGFKVDGLDNNLGEVTFSGNKIVNVGGKTKAIINGIEHKTDFYDLNLYYEEDFNPSSHINENYFNYGKNKIWLGGQGFSSSLKEGNKIFPEFKESYKVEGEKFERKSILEFRPNKGTIEVNKISKNNEPLFLNIKSEGNFKIKNGRVGFLSENENLYTLENTGFDITYDTNLNYNNKYDYVIEKSILKTETGDIIADYTKPYENAIKNVQEALLTKKNELTDIKTKLEYQWGVTPKSYFGTIDDIREEEFLKFTYEAAEIASRNNFEVEVTPQEVMTNFMLEGGINLFKKEDKHIYTIDIKDLIDEDDSTFNYKGVEYKINIDNKGNKFIEINDPQYGVTPLYGISVNELIDENKQFIVYKGKKYKPNKPFPSSPYYYIQIEKDEVPQYYQDHNTPVSGWNHLGTDVAGIPSEQKRLKEGGFWPKDLEVISAIEMIQEQGTKTIPGDFNSLQEGLIGMAGILAERKKIFLDDFKIKFGEEELKKLSKEEMSFWTYMYYNCGQGCGKGHLYGEEFYTGGKKIKGKGRENLFKKLPYEEPIGPIGSGNPQVNALRRLATQLWLEQSGVFDIKPLKIT